MIEFIVGFLLGGLMGIVITCIVQVNQKGR